MHADRSDADATDAAHRRGSDGDGLRQPLLASTPEGGGDVTGGGRRGSRDNEEPTTVAREASRLLKLALPLSVQNVLYIALGLVTSAMVGRLGDVPLAASVLSQAVFNVTGSSLMWGLAAGLETLCGQAYGSKNYRKVGVVLQRALLINLLAASAVAGGLWTNVEPLLLALGQDPHIASLSSRYLRRCIPALMCTAVESCVSRYLMIQGIVTPQFISALVGSILGPLMSYTLIFTLGWGLDGAAIGYSAGIATICFIDVVVVVVREAVLLKDRPEKCWHGWSREGLQKWGLYLEYAIPSYFMISLEWWLYDVLTMMIGLLPNAAVAMATMGIATNISSLAFMLPLGLTDGLITRVSNELGANCPKAAKKAVWAGLLLTLAVQMVQCSVVLALRHKLGYVWTKDEEVVSYLSVTLIPMAMSFAGDGTTCILSGVMRGAGLQVTGVVINVVNYWFAGLPLAYLLTFRLGYGVPGAWAGLACAVATQAAVLLTLVTRLDWERQADLAANRVAALSSVSPSLEGTLRGGGLGLGNGLGQPGEQPSVAAAAVGAAADEAAAAHGGGGLSALHGRALSERPAGAQAAAAGNGQQQQQHGVWGRSRTAGRANSGGGGEGLPAGAGVHVPFADPHDRSGMISPRVSSSFTHSPFMRVAAEAAAAGEGGARGGGGGTAG